MTLVLFPDGTRVDLGEQDNRIVAVLPGALAMVHRAELPGLTDRQALAASRLIVAESSLTPIDAMHVAIGGDDDGFRTVVAVERDVMAQYLALLAGEGIDPDAIIPSTMLLPRPTEGAIRGLVGGDTIVRSASDAFVEEPTLIGLIGETPRDLPLEDVDAAIIAAVALPEVNLRQGGFARSHRWTIDWVAARRLARLAVGLLVLTVAVEFVTLLRIDATAKRIERANAAAQAIPVTPDALPLAGVAVAAVAATSDTDLGALNVDAAGTMRVTVRGRNAAALDQVQARLASSGLRMSVGPTTVTGGRAAREVTLGTP